MVHSIVKLSKSEWAPEFEPRLQNYINVRFYSMFETYFTFWHNRERISSIYEKTYGDDSQYKKFKSNQNRNYGIIQV